MRRGEAPTNEMVVAVIAERIAQPDCANGYVLDGFPRTDVQAELLDQALGKRHVTHVVSLDAPEEILLERVEHRWVHRKSGRSYHVWSAPPRSLRPGHKPCAANMRDDATGQELIRRSEDNRADALVRIREFCQDMHKVVEHYDVKRRASEKCYGAQGMPRVLIVDAGDSLDEVWRVLQARLLE
eukprot:TRINITY_DN5242_c3_g1_i1.p3 TRINITY_DN5242_c3_g1~~TRINITY_DN5242_c3_g1_i1.p3  ORF type:complete len:184 (+),score=48.64 TRINITY_DN5242_c3_g1_i1:397-948(+)